MNRLLRRSWSGPLSAQPVPTVKAGTSPSPLTARCPSRSSTPAIPPATSWVGSCLAKSASRECSGPADLALQAVMIGRRPQNKWLQLRRSMDDGARGSAAPRSAAPRSAGHVRRVGPGAQAPQRRSIVWRPGDDVRALGLKTWTIPGGRYRRSKLAKVRAHIDDMAQPFRAGDGYAFPALCVNVATRNAA